MSAVATINTARTRQEWAGIIGADWRRSIESIIQTGRDLVSAKSELPSGEFMEMVERDLPFHGATASQLMRVAAHPELADFRNSKILPARVSVLIELSTLSADDFKDAQNKGLIGPDLKVKPARAIAGAYNKPEGEIIGGAKHMLPSPDEARTIARETGRLVAANNGKIYTGASDEETSEYSSRRDTAFEIIRAIKALGDVDQDAFEFFKQAERHWFTDFRYSAIDDAIEFLTTLKQAMGVVDA